MKRPVEGEGIRFAIGPANYAGQAYQWARAVRENSDIDALSFAPVSGGFAFPVDVSLGAPLSGYLWTRRHAVSAVVESISHMAIDGFIPIFGPPRMGSLASDCAKLRRRGISVALISHGSDTRDPDAHMERNQHSYYSSSPREYVARLRALSARNRHLARESGLPLYVSTPDLLLDCPQATWLPVAIDMTKWLSNTEVFASRVPTVLHIPSRKNPPIKGTGVIEPIMRKLADARRILYLSPEHVPNGEMPDLVRRSDVVVDQLLIGSYGVAAVEAMAAGRLVIGSVSSATRALMPDVPPIVDASPDDLEEILEDVLSHFDDYARLASKGPAFVSRWHSGRASAAVLDGFLGLHQQ